MQWKKLLASHPHTTGALYMRIMNTYIRPKDRASLSICEVILTFLFAANDTSSPYVEPFHFCELSLWITTHFSKEFSNSNVREQHFAFLT